MVSKLQLLRLYKAKARMGFPHSAVGKELAYSAGDPSSIPGWRRSPEEGNSNPLQYSCLENPMDRGAWPLQSMGSQESDRAEATEHTGAKVGEGFLPSLVAAQFFFVSLQDPGPNN